MTSSMATNMSSSLSKLTLSTNTRRLFHGSVCSGICTTRGSSTISKRALSALSKVTGTNTLLPFLQRGKQHQSTATLRTYSLYQNLNNAHLSHKVHVAAPTNPRVLLSPNAHCPPQMASSRDVNSKSSAAYIAAEGFKTGADNYEKGRPSYTSEAVDYIAAQILAVQKAQSESGSNAKYSVLELGAGTGKMTEVLSKKLPESCRYLAVEPSQDFHDKLASKNLVGVETVVAGAGAIPVENGSAENVVCAQSFHWFADNEYLEEIRRVLVPGGNLIIAMNWKSFEQDWMQPIYDQRKRVYARTGSSLRYLINSFEWQRDIKTSPLYSLKEHVSLPGVEFRGDLEKILHNLTTISAYNMLPKEELDGFVDELRETLKSWPGLDLNDLQIPFSSEIYTYTAQ